MTDAEAQAQAEELVATYNSGFFQQRHDRPRPGLVAMIKQALLAAQLDEARAVIKASHAMRAVLRPILDYTTLSTERRREVTEAMVAWDVAARPLWETVETAQVPPAPPAAPLPPLVPGTAAPPVPR